MSFIYETFHFLGPELSALFAGFAYYCCWTGELTITWAGESFLKEYKERHPS